MDSVYAYTNYRLYLSEFYREKKAANRHFSHRHAAGKVGLKTTGPGKGSPPRRRPPPSAKSRKRPVCRRERYERILDRRDETKRSAARRQEFMGTQWRKIQGRKDAVLPLAYGLTDSGAN